jgi:benzylsuccinate CoA-transferase BbsE subunit
LNGVRVLDLSGEIGHFCGKLLAGMGAEVIKVEPPPGDPLRRQGPFLHDRPGLERSLRWLTLNSGKRGVTLDRRRPDGRRLFEALLSETDVVLESEPPTLPAAEGWSPEEVIARFPSLVWVSITGFGRDGPYAGFAWSDLIGQASGGLMFLLGDEDRPPVRFGAPQAYYQAAMQAAVGVAAALWERTASGLGQQLDVSLQEAVTFTLQGPGPAVGWWTQGGGALRRAGGRLKIGPLAGLAIQPCADGWIANGGYYVGTWFPTLLALLQADGMAGDLSDPKWLTAVSGEPGPGLWQVSQDEIDHVHAVVGDWLLEHTKAEFLGWTAERGLMIYPVNTVPDLLANPQLQTRAFWERLPHPALAETLTLPGPPFRLSETPWSISRPAPTLGQDNRAIYAGRLGLSNAELASLSAGRVL